MRSDKFARLERLGEIIVGAHFQALDAALGRIARRQHQDRYVGVAADRLGEIETGLTRHHHVENKQIETQADQLGARVGRGLGRADAIALAGEEARQQVTDAAVVIDYQQMRRIVRKRGGLH